MKNIIICSDGTGNSGGSGSESNVWRIYRAINRASPDTPQVAFYDDGVGTESFKPLRIFASVFGYGLSRNVKQLYTEICRVYEPGDKLYYFGFSRGAFTVRTLMAWIMEVGLVDPSTCGDSKELAKLVNASYKTLRSQFNTVPQRLLGLNKNGERHYKKFSRQFYDLNDHQKKSLGHFIGVWDTVDAVGFPIAYVASFWNSWVYPFKFPNYKLNTNVRSAYHALAIDDERHTFHPLPWDEAKIEDQQDLQQVWFSGMHANVGGGYPQDGMAYTPLVWIIDAAEQSGLSFTDSVAVLYRERANPMERMYNSRAGLGAYYRFTPRNLQATANKYNFRKTIVHQSVIARTKQSPNGYTPRHLPTSFSISPDNDQNRNDASELQRAMANQLEQVECEDVSDISRSWDFPRVILQWFVVLFSIFFIAAATMSGVFIDKPWAQWLAKVLAGTSDTVQWENFVYQAGILLMLAFVFALIAEKNANVLRSRFWVAALKNIKRKFR